MRQGRAGGNEGCYQRQHGQPPLHPPGRFAMPCTTYARGVCKGGEVGCLSTNLHLLLVEGGFKGHAAAATLCQGHTAS